MDHGDIRAVDGVIERRRGVEGRLTCDVTRMAQQLSLLLTA